MVGLQTLDLAIGVRVPASQPNSFNKLRATQKLSRLLCAWSVQALKFASVDGRRQNESDVKKIGGKLSRLAA